jgi:hypothetical protein
MNITDNYKMFLKALASAVECDNITRHDIIPSQHTYGYGDTQRLPLGVSNGLNGDKSLTAYLYYEFKTDSFLIGSSTNADDFIFDESTMLSITDSGDKEMQGYAAAAVAAAEELFPDYDFGYWTLALSNGREDDLGELTVEEAREALLNNDYNWYVVQYTDGSFDLKHESSLSAILECGKDAADYDISEMWKCWNSEEIGEYPF